MRPNPRRRLAIPTVLAVGAFAGAPSCKDDSGNDTGADTSISGEGECFDILDMSACESEAAFECRWEPQNEGCVPNCPAYQDQATCDDDQFCLWVTNTCVDRAL